MTRESPHHVVMPAFDGMQMLDVTGPLDCFAEAGRLAGEAGRPGYRLSLISENGGMVRTSAGIGLETIAGSALDMTGVDTLLVPGGSPPFDYARDPFLTGLVLRAAEDGQCRLGAVCTGAFLLAATGVLDGRRAVTHWRFCDALQRDYPDIRVEADAIHVRDGGVWTSAGVTAGIDLALAMIEADHGRDLAARVARNFVVYLKRSGGQSQFSSLLESQMRSGHRGFDELNQWIAENLGQDLGVEMLASRCAMSPRHFARAYKAHTGLTPGKFIEKLRVESARRAIEEDAGPLAWIAREYGFGYEERMRRSFQRLLNVTPSEYRDHNSG